MHLCRGYGVHVRLKHMLDHHGDPKLPGTNLLLVRSCDEISPLVDEGDCVDSTGVLGLVFEVHVAFPHVVLDNMLIVVPDQK